VGELTASERREFASDRGTQGSLGDGGRLTPDGGGNRFVLMLFATDSYICSVPRFEKSEIY